MPREWRRFIWEEGRVLRTEDRPTYAAAVWETFSQKYQPSRLTMSSAEFQVISRWMDAAIPLAIILRGLEETGGNPKTLMACERPVERAVAYWRQAAGLM